MDALIKMALSFAQDGLNLYQRATANVKAVAAEMSATDQAAALAQLESLHAQYETDYQAARAALVKAAAEG
jgi:hypothetical protein